MLKQQIIECAEKWGYILVYPEYSPKAQTNLWTAKVPTTEFKSKPSFTRTRKILEDENLEQLLEQIKQYFSSHQKPIKIILRENKLSLENQELFTI